MEVEIENVILLIDLSKKVAENESRRLNDDEFDGSEGQAVKITIPSNIIDICTRFRFVRFKKCITFLTGYNGIINITNRNNKFLLLSVPEVANYNVIRIPTGAYEI